MGFLLRLALAIAWCCVAPRTEAGETRAEQLRAALATADRLEIAWVEFDPNRKTPVPSEPGALTDPAAIAELLALIAIDDERSGFGGEPDDVWEWRFSSAGKPLAVLIYPRHRRALRWLKGALTGYSLLTDDCAARLPAWFDAHGIPQFLAAQRNEEEWAAKQKKEDEEFVSMFPVEAREKAFTMDYAARDFEEGEKRHGLALAASMPGPELMLASCHALGHSDESWTSTVDRQRIVLAAVETCTAADYAAALARIAPEDDRSLDGAARIGFWSRFLDRLPEGTRGEAAARLARFVLDSNEPGGKTLVLDRLADFPGAPVDALLGDIARGTAGKPIPAKAVGENPNLRAGAILVLAGHGDVSMRPLAAALVDDASATAADRAAAAVALAYLGDASRLSAAAFKLESYPIGLGAITAIERFGGREGMDLLIDGALSHPYANVANEAVTAIQRLTGMDWTSANGHAQERFCADRIRAWWREHRAEFLAKHGTPVPAAVP